MAANERYVAVAIASRQFGALNGGDVVLYEASYQGWLFRGLLMQGEPVLGDQGVGASIAISGDRILVGAPRWNGVGAVFLFTAEGGVPGGGLYQMGSGSGYEFGAAVAFEGDVPVIGAPGENGGAGGVWLSQPGLFDSTIHIVAPPTQGSAGRFGATLCATDARFVAAAPGEDAVYVLEGSGHALPQRLAAPVTGAEFGAARRATVRALARCTCTATQRPGSRWRRSSRRA